MPPASTTSPATAFAVACLGIMVFSAMDAVMKHLSIALGAYNALLWRTVVGVALIAPFYLAQARRLPDRKTLILHLARSLTAAASVLLFFWGLVRTPLAQGIALSFIAPLIALGLAALFLKEKVGRRAVGGSLAAFAGVLVILAFQTGPARTHASFEGAVSILVAAVLYAVNLVIARRQSLAAGPIEVAFYFNLIAAGFFGCAAPWLAHMPAREHWPMILLASVVGTSAIILLAWAYARAETQQLVAVEYTAFIWAALLGWWVFGERVSPATGAGAALIVAGCLWASRQRQTRTAEPEAFA